MAAIEEEGKEAAESAEGEPAPIESHAAGTPAPDVENGTPVTGESDGLETKLEDIKPVLVTPAVVSGRFRYIEEQLAARIRLSNSWECRDNPGLNDQDAWTEYTKDYKEHSKQFRHASANADNHMKVLTLSLRRIQIDHPSIDVGNYIENAYQCTPMNTYEHQPSSTGSSSSGGGTGRAKELEGQLKLELKGKDDGSEAEPAGECTVTVVAPADLDAELEKRDQPPLDGSRPLPIKSINRDSLSGFFIDYFDIAEEHDDQAAGKGMVEVLHAAIASGISAEAFEKLVKETGNEHSIYGLINVNRVLEALQQRPAETKETKPKTAKGKKNNGKETASAAAATETSKGKARAPRGKASNKPARADRSGNGKRGKGSGAKAD